MNHKIVLETDRLTLRQLTTGDAAFILRLLNEPSFVRHIGDKDVRSLSDAENYILTGPVDMYHRLGFGLWLVEQKPNLVPIGLCGLLKRETLDDVDIGFALLPEFCRKGYAYEAASATLEHAQNHLQLSRLVATTSQDNSASGRLLDKLGFEYEQLIPWGPDEETVKLFVFEA